MSLASRISSLATRMANELRDNYKPRLLPSGGASNAVLAKTSATNYATGWIALKSGAFVNITVGTTAPASPSVGDIWIDTN